jgi:hypothetical protein
MGERPAQFTTTKRGLSVPKWGVCGTVKPDIDSKPL